MKYFMQHLKAGNSPNGNPQRVFIFYDEHGRIKSVTDEGFKGKPKCKGLEIIELPSFNISKSEYHWWIREAKRLGTFGVIET